MISAEKPTNSDSDKPGFGNGRALVYVLGALIGLEAIAVVSGAGYFFSQLFVQEVTNTAGAIVIFAITVLIGLALVGLAIATWLRKSWTRGAIITWQIIQFALATSFIQGIDQWQPIGWLLLFLSVATAVVTVVMILKEPR
jgi:hypothetical protein